MVVLCNNRIDKKKLWMIRMITTIVITKMIMITIIVFIIVVVVVVVVVVIVVITCFQAKGAHLRLSQSNTKS